MSYEMAIRCDGCGQMTPSMKMFRTLADNHRELADFIYEHSSACMNEYRRDMTFTRIVECDPEWVKAPLNEWIIPK